MGSIKPAVWKEKERLNGRIVDGLTVILRTRGCRWDGCHMCGYTNEAYPATEEDLIRQIDFALSDGAEVVKIFTSGSFFDDAELTEKVRIYLLDKLKEIGVKKLIVESRPEFIDRDKLETFKDVNLEVGIGLESASDEIRELCINKGFTFEDFREAAEMIKEVGFRVKCYLLLKPPFLSESEAINDALRSIEVVKGLADVISLNLTNVQKGTLVEKLWNARIYRPPWLWSAVEVLKNVKGIEIMCDPVAAGKARGPHNCGKCDSTVAGAIRNFSLTQDSGVFENLDCTCREKWKKSLELEDFSRIPLF
ncbi:archaeosine biosynthesis radical SAM protein RaSEA [Archaeoglobus neptunius]|uniref:archaeosine biosynthesis radical SAM protein RaSEA n=1 Tax=Archaeoglobus neptunius TaxID=2798580 RepID=UPI0019268346|nr:archaeosine biosynthesis radical SAM protein RaSEA [Archaeoglobus neptunius]